MHLDQVPGCSFLLKLMGLMVCIFKADEEERFLFQFHLKHGLILKRTVKQAAVYLHKLLWQKIAHN